MGWGHDHEETAAFWERRQSRYTKTRSLPQELTPEERDAHAAANRAAIRADEAARIKTLAATLTPLGVKVNPPEQFGRVFCQLVIRQGDFTHFETLKRAASPWGNFDLNKDTEGEANFLGVRFHVKVTGEGEFSVS